MGYHYSNPANVHILGRAPDFEVFYVDRPSRLWGDDPNDDPLRQPGWYWAVGEPGKLWVAPPQGPFETEAEAIEEAREPLPQSHRGARKTPHGS